MSILDWRGETRRAMGCPWGSSAGGIGDAPFGGTVCASAHSALHDQMFIVHPKWRFTILVM
jgi:hypothetical protein